MRRKKKTKLFQTKKSPLTLFVYKHFIAPVETLLELSTEEAIATWMDIKNRDVYFCRADEPFQMVGREKFHPTNANKWQYGTTQRDIRKGQSIMVRLDGRAPDLVDVDINLGEEVRTFVLNRAEYQFLCEKLEVIY